MRRTENAEISTSLDAPPPGLGERPTYPSVRRAYVRHDPTRLREAILAAATAEFLAKGYAGARIAAIASAARANKRMIYLHYGSKPDLHRAVLDRELRRLRSAEAAIRVTGPPLEAIRQLFTALFACYADHAVLLTRLAQDWPDALDGWTAEGGSPAVESADRIIGAGVDAGVFSRRVSAQQLCAAAMALATSAVPQDLAPGQRVKLFESMVLACLRARAQADEGR